MNTSFTKLITTTLQNLPAEVFDAVSTNNALFYMLQKRGNLKIKSGGRTFTHPIWWLENSSFKSYAKLDTIDTPLIDDLTRAEYPIKIVAGSMTISLLDEAMNNGKEQLIDLAEETITRGKLSMAKEMGEQVWKDGTAVNDFDGLPHLINTSPSTQTDVGGINPTNYSQWRNYVYPTAVTGFNTNQAGVSAMNTMLLESTFGATGPRLVVTTKTIFNLYELGLQANQRYLTTELVDTKFLHLAYATMPVVPDDNCTAQRMYFVDLDSLFLQALSGGNMEIKPMEQSIDALSKIALLWFFGNLTCGSRRTQAISSVISA